MLKRSEAAARAPKPAAPEAPASTVREEAAAAAKAPRPEQPPAGNKATLFAAEGDEVTVYYGTEKYSPVQYNTFEHGPFFVKVKVGPGESHADAATRAWNAAAAAAAATYPVKEQAFLDNLRKLGGKV